MTEQKREVVADPSAEKVLLNAKEFTLQEVLTCLRVLEALAAELPRGSMERLRGPDEESRIREVSQLVIGDALVAYCYRPSRPWGKSGLLEAFELNDWARAMRLIYFHDRVEAGVFDKYGGDVVRGWNKELNDE